MKRAQQAIAGDRGVCVATHLCRRALAARAAAPSRAPAPLPAFAIAVTIWAVPTIAITAERDGTEAVTTASVAPPPSRTAAVEEIVVTARKRTESLQQVPISAVVVSGAILADQGIATLQDFTNTLPAVKLAKGSGTNRQFIRGVGSGDNASFEQSVGTFVDDLYHGRARTSEALRAEYPAASTRAPSACVGTEGA